MAIVEVELKPFQMTKEREELLRPVLAGRTALRLSGTFMLGEFDSWNEISLSAHERDKRELWDFVEKFGVEIRGHAKQITREDIERQIAEEMQKGHGRIDQPLPKVGDDIPVPNGSFPDAKYKVYKVNGSTLVAMAADTFDFVMGLPEWVREHPRFDEALERYELAPITKMLGAQIEGELRFFDAGTAAGLAPDRSFSYRPGEQVPELKEEEDA